MSVYIPMETRECGCVVPETIYCAHTPTPKQVNEVAASIAHVPGESWNDYQRQAEAAWRVVANVVVPSGYQIGVVDE